MTLTRKYPVSWAIALLMGIFVCSCSGYNPAFNRENIKAAWLADTKDGVLLENRNERMVYIFDENGTVQLFGVKNLGDGNYKWGDDKVSYAVDCCLLRMSGSFTGFFDIPTKTDIEFDYDIVKQRDSLIVITPTKYEINSTEVDPGYADLRMHKLNNKYAAVDSISGIWEVKSKDGAGYNLFRLGFNTGNELVFYTKAADGSWVDRPIGNEGGDTYHLYSDFIALTIYGNSIMGTSSKWNVICFDIDSLSPYTGKLEISSSTTQYQMEAVLPE